MIMEELSGFASLLVGPRCSCGSRSTQPSPKDHRNARAVCLSRARRQPGSSELSVGDAVLRVFDSKTRDDVTEVTRAGWPGGPHAYDQWSQNADAELSRAVLRGPSDREAEALRGAGRDPEAARRIAEHRLASELELVDILNHDDQWRRGRLTGRRICSLPRKRRGRDRHRGGGCARHFPSGPVSNSRERQTVHRWNAQCGHVHHPAHRGAPERHDALADKRNLRCRRAGRRRAVLRRGGD